MALENNNTQKQQMTAEQIAEAKKNLYDAISNGMDSGVSLKKGASPDDITKALFAKAKDMEKSLIEKDALPTYPDSRSSSVKEHPIKVSSFEYDNKEGEKIRGGSIEFKVSNDTLKYNFNDKAELTSVKLSHLEFVDKKPDPATKSNVYVNDSTEMPEKLSKVYEAIGLKNPERERTNDDKGKVSESFQKYLDMQKAVKEASPTIEVDARGEDGQPTGEKKSVSEYYVTDFQSFNNKDGERQSSFSIKDHDRQQIDIRINDKAEITSARYIDWKGYDGETKTFAEGCDAYNYDVKKLTAQMGDFGKIVDKALDAVSYEPIADKVAKEVDDFVKADDEMELPFD